MINENLISPYKQAYKTTHQKAHAQIKEIDRFSIRIDHEQPKVKVNELLPFRIQFINVGVFGYSKDNPPSIPLQIIGYSNYIL